MAWLWSDNLQLPYTSKLEVIWDQTTSNFLVYNFQLPHGRHCHGGHVGRCGHGSEGDHGETKQKKHARFLVDLNDLTTGHNLHTLLDTDVDVDIDSDSDNDVDMMWLGCDITIFNAFTVWTNIYFWTSFEFWRQFFILSQSPACITSALQRKLFPGRY